MSLCLQARQLACERDDRWLFEGLDLDIQSGEIVRIEGPNGSGKTCLLQRFVERCGNQPEPMLNCRDETRGGVLGKAPTAAARRPC